MKKNDKHTLIGALAILLVLLIVILFLIKVFWLTTLPYHPLGFAIYTDQSTFLSKFKNYYSEPTPNSLLIDDEYNMPPRVYITYWNQPQQFDRMILANNYSELISNMLSPYVNNVRFARAYNFSGSDYIGYDAEDWNLTPLYEQYNQSSYVQLACNYVHDAGYKFAYTPELDGITGSQLKEINWSCVDLFDMQEQVNTNNTYNLTKNVSHLISISRSHNPNIVIFVQLDMQAANQSVLQNDIGAMGQIQGVSGVMIEDKCTSASCNSTLTDLVDYIKNITNDKVSSKI